MDEETKKELEKVRFQLNQQAEEIKALTKRVDNSGSILIPNWGHGLAKLEERVKALEEKLNK